MLRKILAVITGYFVMAIFVMLSLGGIYMAIGSERAFEPGTYQITTLWLVSMFAVGLLAAIFGGVTCAKVSKHSKHAVIGLMLLVLVLGVSMALDKLKASDAEMPLVREPGTSMMDAMNIAKEPVWVSFTHPIIGCLGVMIGAMIVCPCRKGSCDVPAEQSVEE